MLCLRLDFPAGRYHATPWGHHVNEGLVEWPPSPWRIVRALLGVGYAKHGWNAVPPDAVALAEALGAVLPEYRLPLATPGHTRHFMPVAGFERKQGRQKTSLVIDAFVCPHGPLYVCWPVDLVPAQRGLLGQLIERLGYLGRAESRVQARLVPPEAVPRADGGGTFEVTTRRQRADDEPVRLLAPVPPADYAAWQRDATSAPATLVDALQLDTAVLQREGWSLPPGSREVVYWRPVAAVVAQAAPASEAGVAVDRYVDTALFALSTDWKRDVLPPMERALPVMALFRAALLGQLGDGGRECPELSGKDENGEPLRENHAHAHFIPLSLERRSRGRIDHVLVHARRGLGGAAQRALRRLRRTWAKDLGSVAVTLVGTGPLDDFRTIGGEAVPELGRSARWESRTPFIPPRYLKPYGQDSLEGQVRAELRRRGLPDLSGAPEVTRPGEPGEAGDEARRFRGFARQRKDQPGLPPPGLFRLALTLERPVDGPLCLGWGCHYGLGLFRATPG